MIPYLVPIDAYSDMKNPPSSRALASLGTWQDEPVIVILGGPNWKDPIIAPYLDLYMAQILIPHEELHQVLLELEGPKTTQALDRCWPGSVPGMP